MPHNEKIPEEVVQAILNEDWATAYFVIKPLADGGNMNAEHYMGWFYEQGIQVSQSYEKAFHWWLKAAQKGVPESQSGIAQLYESGRGTTQDFIEAYIWYAKAIMSGDEESRLLISNLSSKMTSAEVSDARSKLHDKT
jgi:TPR repeat protein